MIKPESNNDVCFYESDSSHSTQNKDSDNDSLIEYTKKNKTSEKKNLYKTELCRNWEERGQCRYGTKCQYAHGAHDLREIERHPKYKTQKCRTFSKTGTCPYGARCTFRHFSLPGDIVTEEEDKDDDYLLPPNAESLLPHQLLFDLDPLDEQPVYKSFFRPWLF